MSEHEEVRINKEEARNVQSFLRSMIPLLNLLEMRIKEQSELVGAVKVPADKTSDAVGSMIPDKGNGSAE